MTTITKEWLQQTIAEFENTRDDIPFGLSDDDAKILIVLKRALASLDAEPVGYFYADKPGDWYQISDGDRVPGHRLIPLYASPQSSPAVKLPNEFISSEGIVVQIEKLMAVLAVHGIQYERKGSSCRVDILQAGNSPAIPDDWVMVPRVPTTEMANAMIGVDGCSTSELLVALKLAIAAAPQQEAE